jgi:superfamily II helicase
LPGDEADGCILLDECHKAKNFNAGTDTGSKVAGCVIDLQRRCPDARVVYCSATGISEIGNMAYMQRLGFWGAGTPFTDADR